MCVQKVFAPLYSPWDNYPPMHTSRLTSGLVAFFLLSNTAFAAEVLTFGQGPVTRGDFVKRVVDTLYEPAVIANCFSKLSPSQYRLLFTDVSVTHPAAAELCIAMRAGIIQGYSDGSFRPARPLNFAEASKIITRAMGVKRIEGLSGDMPWFATYVKALEYRGAIPRTITAFDQPMTSSEVNEILYRLEQKITNLPFTGYAQIEARMRSGR